MVTRTRGIFCWDDNSLSTRQIDLAVAAIIAFDRASDFKGKKLQVW